MHWPAARTYGGRTSLVLEPRSGNGAPLNRLGPGGLALLHEGLVVVSLSCSRAVTICYYRLPTLINLLMSGTSALLTIRRSPATVRREHRYVTNRAWYADRLMQTIAAHTAAEAERTTVHDSRERISTDQPGQHDFEELPRSSCKSSTSEAVSECPRQESNLRTRFRKPLLYPLSYGGAGCEAYPDPQP